VASVGRETLLLRCFLRNEAKLKIRNYLVMKS
jgi:hypothetical protein